MFYFKSTDPDAPAVVVLAFAANDAGRSAFDKFLAQLGAQPADVDEKISAAIEAHRLAAHRTERKMGGL